MTPEFPGLLRSFLRDHFQAPGLPVVFIQGMSGDIRPINPFQSIPRTPRQWVHRLLNGDFFGDFTRDDYDRWLSSIVDDMKCALAEAAVLDDVNLQVSTTRRPLFSLLKANVSRCLEAYYLSFSPQLGLLGFSAEVVSAYAERFERIMPHQSMIYGGCINHVFGYVPTDRMIAEGGYEARGFFDHFSIDGPYQEQVEDKVIDVANSVLESARRLPKPHLRHT
jgi:hypothetical protein